MNDLEEMIAAFEDEDDYMQERQRKAKRLKMPTDPSRWLDELERELSETIPSLPSELKGEFTELMESQIKDARRAIKHSSQRLLMAIVLLLHDNLKIIRTNIDKHTAYKVEDQRRDAGFSNGKQRAVERKPVWDEWQSMAEDRWRANQNLSKIDVAKWIAEQRGKSESHNSIRQRIVKPKMS